MNVSGWSLNEKGYIGTPVTGTLEGQALDLCYSPSGKRVKRFLLGPGAMAPEGKRGLGPGYHLQGPRSFWLTATPELDAYVAGS